MRVVPYTNLSTDRPAWISRRTFYFAFDQQDFHCREVQDVEQAYRADWFLRVEGEPMRFVLPVVGVVAGKTQFVSGRHRVAVMLKYMQHIPVAFALGHLPWEAIRIIEAIPKRKLGVSDIIELPDLPIRDALPSHGYA